MSTRLPDDTRGWRARLAASMLRLYPRRWRTRYEAEMRAILEDHGATTRDLVDLAWGAVRERWRGPNGPAPGERPVAAMLWRGGFEILERGTLVTFAGAGVYGLGWLVGSVTGPPADALLLSFPFLVLGVVVWECARGLYRAYRATRILPALLPPEKTPFAVRITLMAVALSATVLGIAGAAHELPTWTSVTNIYLMLTYTRFDAVLDRSGRRRRIADATQRYFGARERRKWANVELARLESLSLPSDHPDLVRQRDEIARCAHQMVTAVEILRHPDQPVTDSGSPSAAS